LKIYIGIIDSILNEEIQNEVDYEASEDCYGSGAPQFSRLHVKKIHFKTSS